MTDYRSLVEFDYSVQGKAAAPDSIKPRPNLRI
jgi:hypothetical protein